MYVNPFLATFANDNDALIPELWAPESVAVLFENMVMGRLIHRNFENIVARFGDIVHTRKPADIISNRKTDADTIVYEDAVLNNVAVPLNLHGYGAFTIKDGEGSKSMQELVEIHLVPTMKGVANQVDRSINGRFSIEFMGTPESRAGRLLNMDSSTSKAFILEANEILHNQLSPVDGRRLVVSPRSENAILGTDLFIKANERGDGGSALENAVMGQVYGFDTFMSQNVPYVNDNAATRDTVASVTSAAIAAGSTGSLTAVDFTGYVVDQGEYVILAGNDQPTWATAVVATTNTTAVTLNEATKYAVASGAVLTAYSPMTVNNAAGYAAGWSQAIAIDGHAANKNLVKGQLLAFGDTPGTRETYSVVEVRAQTSTTTTVLLDRPLDTSKADNEVAFPGPAGGINPAFTRNCMTMVSRPLALPDSSMGARSFVANFQDIAVRATMQYDITAQGTHVVLDLLYGLSPLDAAHATVVLG
jgi:hypothetical protein